MLEFDVYGQDTIRAIPEKENGVRFKSFAALDPASATAVAPAPVIRPAWLLGRL
jgi:hypothetical protein